MRGFGVVFTDTVAHKGIAIACERNTLTLGLKENIVHSILMSVTMKKVATTKTVAIPKKNLLLGSTRSDPSSCQANG